MGTTNRNLALLGLVFISLTACGKASSAPDQHHYRLEVTGPAPSAAVTAYYFDSAGESHLANSQSTAVYNADGTSVDVLELDAYGMADLEIKLGQTDPVAAVDPSHVRVYKDGVEIPRVAYPDSDTASFMHWQDL